MKSLQNKLDYLKSQPEFQNNPFLVISRLLVWRAKTLLGISSMIELKKWTIRLYLPPKWRGVAKLIYVFRDSYEEELDNLPLYLSPGSVFVDVGANYGIYSLIAARIVGDSGRVIAFEPAKENFEILNKNILLNCMNNINLFPLALSDREGLMKLYYHPDPSRNSLIPEHSKLKNGEEVEVKQLDQVLQKIGVNVVDFIKIDVEGADLLVIKGAKETICKYRPVVQFEYIPSMQSGTDLLQETFDFFSRNQYVVMSSEKRLTQPELITTGGNFLAIPVEKLR